MTNRKIQLWNKLSKQQKLTLSYRTATIKDLQNVVSNDLLPRPVSKINVNETTGHIIITYKKNGKIRTTKQLQKALQKLGIDNETTEMIYMGEAEPTFYSSNIEEKSIYTMKLNGDDLDEEYMDDLELEIMDNELVNDNNIIIENRNYDINENCIFYPLRKIFGNNIPYIKPEPISINKASDIIDEHNLKLNLRFYVPADIITRSKKDNKGDYVFNIETHRETSKQKDRKSIDFVLNNNHAVIVFNKKYFKLNKDYITFDDLPENAEYNIIQIYHEQKIKPFIIDTSSSPCVITEIKRFSDDTSTYHKFMALKKRCNIEFINNDFKKIFTNACTHSNLWSLDGITDVYNVYEVDKSKSYMTKAKYAERIPNKSFSMVAGFHIDNENACLIQYPDNFICKWKLPFEMSNVVPVPVVKTLREYGYDVSCNDTKTVLCYSWSNYNLLDEIEKGKFTKEEAQHITGLFVVGGVKADCISTGTWMTKSEHELKMNRIIEAKRENIKKIYYSEAGDYSIYLKKNRRNCVQHYCWALANNACHMIRLLNECGWPLGGNRDAFFYKEKPENIPEGFKCNKVWKDYQLPKFNFTTYLYYDTNIKCTTVPLNLRRINIINAPAGCGKNKGLASMFKRHKTNGVIYTTPTHELRKSQLKYESPYDDIMTGHKCFNLLENKTAKEINPNIVIIDEAQLYCKGHLQKMIKSGLCLIFVYDDMQCTAIKSGYKQLLRDVIRPMVSPKELRRLQVCDPDKNLRYKDEKTKKFFKEFRKCRLPLMLLDKYNVKQRNMTNSELYEMIKDKNSNTIITKHRDACKLYSIMDKNDIIPTTKGQYMKLIETTVRCKYDDYIKENEAGLFKTVYSSQGSTFEGKLNIIGTIYDKNVLYTALSRCRSIDDITIVHPSEFIQLNKELTYSIPAGEIEEYEIELNKDISEWKIIEKDEDMVYDDLVGTNIVKMRDF